MYRFNRSLVSRPKIRPETRRASIDRHFPDARRNRDHDADRGVLLILALTLAPFLFVLGLVLIN